MNTHTPTGQLTAYGLACGYIQRSNKGSYRVDLYREHNSYHVVIAQSGRVILHDTFGKDHLLEARTFYRKLVAGIKRVR